MSNINKQARQVSRFDLVSGYMQKWPDGEYVFHSDYHALLDELEAAEKRIAELEAREVKLPAHKYRECVNGLLEEAIAYAGTQQLRERLSSRLSNFVQPDHPHKRCAAGIITKVGE